MVDIAILASSRNQFRISVPLLVGLGAYAVAVGAAVNLLNDGGTLSHIVIGRWIIEHHALPFPRSIYLHLPRWDLGPA